MGHWCSTSNFTISYLTLLFIEIYKFTTGRSNYPVQVRLDAWLWSQRGLQPEQTLGGKSKGWWETDACYVNVKENSGENNWIKRTFGVKRADKRSFKKKVARSRLTWAAMLKQWEMKKWQKEQLPRKWREKGGEKTEIAMEGRH